MRQGLAYKAVLLAGILTVCARVAVYAQVNQQDSLAVVDFYNKVTNGYAYQWGPDHNWLTSKPLNTWFGITVTGNRVTGIDLSPGFPFYFSPLAIELGKLTELDTLNLANLSFSGNIPDWIGNLKKLRYLNLQKTGLSGNLPPALGSLTNLAYLNLSLNYLSGPIPSTFGNMANLQVLDLHYDNLDSALPASLSNLGKLQVLDLGGNRLKGQLTDLLPYYPLLTHLDLQYNLLSGTIPSLMSNLTHLQYADLGFNLLTGTIPPELGKLISLTDMLSLAGNQLTGPIPPELGKLAGLQRLYLGYNQLAGTIPPELGKLTNLQVFSVINNQLFGSIPPSFAGLQQMREFSIGLNHFKDSIPAFVSSYPHLEELNVEGNRFTFAGMEQVAVTKADKLRYSSQANVKLYTKCNGRIEVSVGGTPSNNTFKWYNSKGDLTATIKGDSGFVPTPGTGAYYVVASNAIATQLLLYSDTIRPLGYPVVKQNITATVCGGRYYTLPSGKKTGTPGLYSDTLRTPGGCDSLITTLNLSVTILKTLRTTANICDGESYLLPNGKTVTASGIYSDTIPAAGGCDSIIHIVTLQVDTAVQQKRLGRALCNGAKANIVAGTPANTYAWSTGETANNITVTTPGQYTVLVKGGNGCTAIDTFDVTVRDTPVVNLASNIPLCYGQLKTIDAGPGYAGYEWSTGNTSQTIQVGSPGYYTIAVTDMYGCTGSKLLNMNTVMPQPAGFLPADTTICTYTAVQVKAADGYAAYLWSDGSTGKLLTINDRGAYVLQVTDGNGCSGNDTINITQKDCIVRIAVPTAFSPNHDGHNDVFKPVYTGSVNFTQYRFSIYNRYGERIFISEDSARGWDGTLKGVTAPTGAYIWFFEYNLNNTGPVKQKGTVVLVR